ncbi:DNA cytosine methyltransferase [Streptomyces botrytidirepellens]|uniref:DNA (cytosine-5-)-methyltransferase n=1 Tax=Streptomyces botrytidirepellens TaxID=2486417 RepID=A0A3M8VYY6_9ACTN|nr:DNA cytosine methyltransferase [Streptomyces botrytidirepellens]RNG23102.1 DNA cytosine methyltransferase [Streptomyces botrytidirepellens]
MNNPGTHAHHLDDVRILDLFAGPGGLDVAAHFLGFKSIGIEWDRNACETRYAAGLPTIHADVSVMRENRFDEIPKSVDVLAGGPPCQSFSVAGNGAGRRALDTVKEFIHRLVDGEDEARIDEDLHSLGDSRTALVLEPLRWLIKAIETEDRDPYKMIVLEQVPAVLPLWEVYAKLLRGGEGRLAGVKYEAECWELKTEQFGVPQTRKRAVLVARMPGEGAIEPLEATHLPFELQRGKRNAPQAETFPTDFTISGAKPRWISMAEALDAASKLKDSPVDVSRLRTGSEIKFFIVSNYGSGGDPKNRGRRKSSEPAFTVTGKISRNKVYKSLADYEADRFDRFTIPEAGVLQTFPHNYPWSGNDQAQQVGNAVPPRLGMHVLGRALRGDTPSAEELAASSTWPSVSPATTDELRQLGCGDQSRCPPESHKVTRSRQETAP